MRKDIIYIGTTIVLCVLLLFSCKENKKEETTTAKMDLKLKFELITETS